MSKDSLDFLLAMAVYLPRQRKKIGSQAWQNEALQSSVESLSVCSNKWNRKRGEKTLISVGDGVNTRRKQVPERKQIVRLRYGRAEAGEGGYGEKVSTKRGNAAMSEKV